MARQSHRTCLESYVLRMPEFFQCPVVLLFDCDKNKPNDQKGRLYRQDYTLECR